MWPLQGCNEDGFWRYISNERRIIDVAVVHLFTFYDLEKVNLYSLLTG